MKSLMGAGSLGLLCVLFLGCSSDATTDGSAGASSAGASATAGSSSSAGSSAAGASAAGASSVDPTDCAAVAAQQKSRITALGCKDTSQDIKDGCDLIYASKLCVSEWEALIECITPKPNSDFECGASDNELDPKTGVCNATRTAFDTCLGG